MATSIWSKKKLVKLMARKRKRKVPSLANNVVNYTKHYACQKKRQQVGYEHGVNRKRNLRGNPEGMVVLRRTYK